jgi:integrase
LDGTPGTTADLKIDAARSLAQQTIRRIKEGKPAIEPPKPQPHSVVVIAERWLTRHVEKNKHRRGAESRRIVEKYVLPYWGERAFTDLKRGDIALLLDHIEDKHGAGTADRTLVTLRAIASWHQARDDAYVPPFVRGMSRSPKAARARILSDAELRAVWKAAESSGQFGAIVRLLLLSAQRREKVHSLRWDDVDGDVWTIRTAEREKGNPGKLKLPPIALDTIRAQPRFVGNPYVFAGQHGAAWHILSGGPKRDFDAKCGVTDWRLHDLRRTARSLMSRAGVQSEHAERVLGHAIGGVEGIYNRHNYDVEKADALTKLAALIHRITKIQWVTGTMALFSLRPYKNRVKGVLFSRAGPPMQSENGVRLCTTGMERGSKGVSLAESRFHVSVLCKVWMILPPQFQRTV